MGNEFVVSLQMDGTIQRQLTVLEGAMVEAQAYEIDSPEMAEIVNAELRSVIQRKKQVKEWKEGFVAPAKTIISNAEKLFDPALVALGDAEIHHKGLLKGWTEKEEWRITDQRRKAEDEARRIRQEAEQKAAAERARAEQQAAEERRKAEAAEQERQRAEVEAARARTDGDKQAALAAERRAAAAAAEAAKRDELARAKTEEGEAKAQNAELSAMATIQAAAPATVTSTPSGFGLKTNWVARLKPYTKEIDVIKAIAAELAARPELVSYLLLNIGAASKAAKAMRENFNVPGLIAVNERISTSRKAS